MQLAAGLSCDILQTPERGSPAWLTTTRGRTMEQTQHTEQHARILTSAYGKVSMAVSAIASDSKSVVNDGNRKESELLLSHGCW